MPRLVGRGAGGWILAYHVDGIDQALGTGALDVVEAHYKA